MKNAIALLSASLLAFASTAPASAQSTQWMFCTAMGGDHFYISDFIEVSPSALPGYRDKWDKYIDDYVARGNLPTISSANCYGYNYLEDAQMDSDDDYIYYYDEGYAIHDLKEFR